MNTTLIAIAHIDVDGSASLTPFRKGEVSHRSTAARAADLAIVLDKDLVIVSAARITSVKEGRFTLSTKDLPAVLDYDLAEVVTVTPWVRRRPTRYLAMEFSPKGVLQSVMVATPEMMAARSAEKFEGTTAISIVAA